MEKSLIDHRVYTIAPRKMNEFLEAFNRLALPVLLETVGEPVGMYVTKVGPLNQFVHLWAYKDLADYEERGKRRETHPEFAEYLAATEGLVVAQENKLLQKL